MTISTAVKWAVSSMTGAPTLNGTAGSLIALLDAFLVNGFGTKAVDSAQVTGGVCRLAITGSNTAQDHCVIQLAGVTGDGVVLNGNQRVKTAGATYVEFACDLPDGPLTGTITFKIAPLGWEKVFSKTNVAVYRSTDVSGTRAYYRVDDTNAQHARVTMYETMSDVDDGKGASPLASTGGYYWTKRQSAGGQGVYWVLKGDSRHFALAVAPNNASSPATSIGFGLYAVYAGDVDSYRSGDPWCAMLTGAVSNGYTDLSGCVFSTNGSGGGFRFQRLSAGYGVSVQASKVVWGSTGNAVSGADGSQGPFPSRADNGWRLSPIEMSDGAMSANGPRGVLRSTLHCTQTGLIAVFGSDVLVHEGVGAFAGKKLLTFGIGRLDTAATGCGVFDIGGA